jgi:hypothetical protein
MAEFRNNLQESVVLTRINTNVLVLTSERQKIGKHLAFLVDVLQHRNNLNLIPRGKYLLVHELYTVVQAKKMCFFSKQVKESEFTSTKNS